MLPTLRLPLVSLALLASAGCHHATPTTPAPASASAPASADSPALFRLETRKGREERLVADVRINRQPAQLALDTGASEMIILFAPSLARLKLDVTRPVLPDPAPVPGRAQLGVTAATEVEFLGRRYPHTTLPFVAVPPGISTADLVDGVIGWPAIARTLLRFTLGETPPSVGTIPRVPAENTGWTKFSMVAGNTLSLRFTDSGPTAPQLLIDTGNDDGVLLAPPRWRAWLAAHPTARRTTHAAVIYGQPLKVHEGAWADDLNINGLVLRGVPVREADPAYLRHAVNGGEIVVLGLAALKRLELVLDGKNRTAYAKPSATPPPGYRHDRTGGPVAR
ncbi:MAG: hypothetical protein H7343_18735 [Undibacterium sp.]|nr:hypothetical protein [Opitutaceae bacterium]